MMTGKLNKEDVELYEALLKVRNDPALKPIVKWLEDMRESTRDRLETCPDRYQVEQGKAQVLRRILTDIAQAPTILGR